jgi:peptidoglycan/xylan/chitin deacetylase (PgdA/CDA1 family)
MKTGLRHTLIRAGLELLSVPGVGSLLPLSGRRGLILTLHHVGAPAEDAFAPNAHLTVSPDFLERTIDATRKLGFEPVRLEDLPRRLAENSQQRLVAFTLDDGYRDNARLAAPVFRRAGVPYTIFLTPGFVDRSRSAWWETAEAMLRRTPVLRFDFGRGQEEVPAGTRAEKLAAFARIATFAGCVDEDRAVARIDEAAGRHGVDRADLMDELAMDEGEIRALARDPLVSFGAHTLTHINLRRVDAARLAREIEGSASEVTAITGRRPLSFAYPYGGRAAVGPREIEAAAQAGFRLCVTTEPGLVGHASLSHLSRLPRMSLNGHFQKARYVRSLASGLLPPGGATLPGIASAP